MSTIIPATQRVDMKVDGNRVLLAADGKFITSMPWEKALEVAAALVRLAREAEENEKALAIAQDGAILLRAGAPFGLTNNPKIQAEVKKLAEHDTKLRRYMPAGVKGKGIVGTPTIINHSQKDST